MTRRTIPTTTMIVTVLLFLLLPSADDDYSVFGGLLSSTAAAAATSATATATATATTTKTTTTTVRINDNNNNDDDVVVVVKDDDDDDVLDAILAHNVQAVDGAVSGSLTALRARGAHRCWHKHSTFQEHLLGVHNILRLWNQGHIAGRVGLFHSAYSNSYVNLALFDPDTERGIVRDLIGATAEDLVHTFCSIDRQEIVVNTLLKQGYIPAAGLTVKSIRNPADTIYLSETTLQMLIVFTMADTADQYFGWQDDLFGGGGDSGSMIIPGMDFPARHNPNALWPGHSRPGLWMSYISQLGRVLTTTEQQRDSSVMTVEAGKGECPNKDDNSTVPNDGNLASIAAVPPVFNHCTATLSVEDEAAARDLYWSVVTEQVTDHDAVIDTLKQCHEKNPYAFEPLVLLAQKLLQQQHDNSHVNITASMQASAAALELQKQWGTCWDRRMPFNAWVSWTRVLHQRAADEQQPWPDNSWQVNNFGLVH